ncbi:MAG: ABC transporter permease [Pseudomonadota bacterium]
MYSKENLVAFRTIIIKEMTRILRIWTQTLLPPAITMALYFVIFGKLIGERIGTMDGFTYMEYIVPGLVMMSIITSAYGNVTSSFFSAKFNRYVEEILVSPTPNSLILLGFIGGGVLRGLLVGVIVTLISLFFTKLQVNNLGLMILVAFFTAVLFSLGGFINAVFATKFDDVAIVPTFILTPLTYLGGVFYSINMLPDFWYNVSLLNPILYMVNAFRYSVLGVSDIPILIALAIIMGFVVVFYMFCLYLLDRGVGLRT